jgi:small subunit ribosomal protein S5
MKPDPLFDNSFTTVTRGRRSGRFGRITVRNEPVYQDQPSTAAILDQPSNDDEEKNALELLPIPKEDWGKLHRYPLQFRRVTQQTGKGKKHRQYMLMVVGNGDGLVGYGEGKHDDPGVTQERAFIEAVRNMDYVERFEKRTIWTDMSIKLGSTRILMRPRPVGFGLRCNPNIHQVLKAAGIKDVSAKVWGSRNPINVIKATCMLIQSGNAPLSMGNGVGGKGRRLDAGSGMRGREAIERERGRKLVDSRVF